MQKKTTKFVCSFLPDYLLLLLLKTDPKHTFCARRGRFHQHWRPTFLRAQNEKLFSAHKFGERRMAFRKFRPNITHNIWLVKLNGEFFAKHRAPASFRLVLKVGWNRPQQGSISPNFVCHAKRRCRMDFCIKRLFNYTHNSKTEPFNFN